MKTGVIILLWETVYIWCGLFISFHDNMETSTVFLSFYTYVYFYGFVRSSHTVLDIILMQFNTVHIFGIYSFKSYFNIIPASMPRPHKPSLFLEFSKQNFIGIFPYTIHSQLYCIQASKILMESAKNCHFYKIT